MTEQVAADLCVIGAGSGGLSVAAGAVQMGAKVVLLEGGKMGGDCLNYGCVPSKALIAAAKRAHAMTVGENFGIEPVQPRVNFAKVKDHVFSVIAAIEPHDSVERFQSLGVNVIQEYGAFVSPQTVMAGNCEVKARRFVIATGSSPLVPPIPGLDSVPHETNETIFELRERPDHLVIIGGGPIGMEMAQAHRRLGCEVTVIEGLIALGRSYRAHAEVVLDRVRAEGVKILESASAKQINGEAGRIEVVTDTGEEISGTHLLVAVGRRPNIEKLNIEAAGIERTRAGIKVDRSLRTTNRRVYAIGDVAGGAQFTHVAGYHAGVVIKSALFALPSKVRTDHIPSCTFTDPEIAEVGLSEAEATKIHGKDVEICSFDYRENDRALAEGYTVGQVRVLVVKGRPVGASIVGSHAGELIETWSLAIANRLKMSAFANMVSPYPTLGEISKRAAGAYFSKRLFGSGIVKSIVRIVQRT